MEESSNYTDNSFNNYTNNNKPLNMYRRKLIQKLQQLIDKLEVGSKRKEAKKDLLDLKISDSDYHYVSLRNKYKELWKISQTY